MSTDVSARPPVCSKPGAEGKYPPVQELSSQTLSMAPLPPVSGKVMQALGANSLLGWLRGKEKPDTSAPSGSSGTPQRSLQDRISDALAVPLGESTPEDRRALFDTIMKMIIRTEGGERDSYQSEEALEQYTRISQWLHKDQSFKEFAETYCFIADNVDLSHAPIDAFDYVNNRLHGKEKEQKAYLAILDNTWDPWVTKKLLKEVNRVSLRHKWEDRSDAMTALTNVMGRMTVEYFKTPERLQAVEAFEMLKKHLKEGETIKDAAEELQQTLDPLRPIYSYHNVANSAITFSREIRKADFPPAERKLLMRGFSRFGNSNDPAGYAAKTLALVKEPCGSSSFEERDGIMRSIMEQDYEPAAVHGSYEFIRDTAGSDEAITDVAKAFMTFRNSTYSAGDAKKALLFCRNELKKDRRETEFFASLFTHTRTAERAQKFYEAIESEPQLKKRITTESYDDRRGIIRDLISWYMESERHDSKRKCSQWDNDKVMESALMDYRTMADLTKKGESPLEAEKKFTTYISWCRTSDFPGDARKALSFTRKDLNDDPREIAYFDAIMEKTGSADYAVSHYKAFAGLQIFDSPTGTESREARRDLFMSRLLRYSGNETKKCISRALRDYELITTHMNPGESLQEAEKRIDAWIDRIHSLTTLKEHSEPHDAMTLLARLKEPGETLDETLARTTGAINTIQNKPPYNGFDDMWFTDFTRPIYLGLTFLADSLESGALGNVSPKQALEDLMTLLSETHYIDKIKELMLERASLAKAEEEKIAIQQVDDQVIIAGIKLDMRKMYKLEL